MKHLQRHLSLPTIGLTCLNVSNVIWVLWHQKDFFVRLSNMLSRANQLIKAERCSHATHFKTVWSNNLLLIFSQNVPKFPSKILSSSRDVSSQLRQLNRRHSLPLYFEYPRICIVWMHDNLFRLPLFRLFEYKMCDVNAILHLAYMQIDYLHQLNRLKANACQSKYFYWEPQNCT